ncbi:Chromosome partition protein Smc [Tetrabaena socialis]|uniref:Chromosome partition protein Smc n=1 Tax=Tetrabaena socialis TaxID=47790 RepID=A0A2J7ZVL8_9CHLO|nr:Chromosome partition protein Smc [Tetrabaena socialis]|eukprot:PNH04305.1 Chromosome partition protein Smc [Tetrabaena socialis]
MLPALPPPPGHWYLASVRVRGFKSFGPWADAPLCSPHLVGVVGPNGSGKSNLLEAVLFAAGCSAGALRARALRELAHSDSADSLPSLPSLSSSPLPLTVDWVESAA